MLSYQHPYHAGSLTDVHKHALLCCALDTMRQKDKPLTYLETHAGRGLYFLDSVESLKTGEASAGILKLIGQDAVPEGHPYAKVLKRIQQEHGPNAYPGSPLIAETMLRWSDHIHLAEKHPQELAALQELMKKKKAKVYGNDGYQLANALLPPTPRRGFMLIDPSYEIKEEYEDVAAFIIKMNRKWPVGMIALWYPLLDTKAHRPMIDTLKKAVLPKVFNHEVMFDGLIPAHHGLRGSGMFFINAPFGIEDKAKEVESFFA